MSVAPRDQLNEEERRQLDNHLSRQARKRSQALEGAENPHCSSPGYHTTPSTHPHTSSVATPPDTRSTSRPDLYDDEVGIDKENHGRDIIAAPFKASPAAKPQYFLWDIPSAWDAGRQRDCSIAPESASAQRLHDPADEQKNRISGSIDEVGSAGQSIGYDVTGHGRSRLPGAGPRSTPLLTPDAGTRDQDQSTPSFGRDPFATPTSPQVTRTRGNAHAHDQLGHLRPAIGPVSVEAHMHTVASVGREFMEELRDPAETEFHARGEQVSISVDPGFVLLCAGIVTFLWVVWWLWST